MPKSDLVHLECDLCHDVDNFKSQPLAESDGWVVFETESPYEDRAWFSHCVCPSCAKAIHGRFALVPKKSKKEAT